MLQLSNGGGVCNVNGANIKLVLEQHMIISFRRQLNTVFHKIIQPVFLNKAKATRISI